MTHYTMNNSVLAKQDDLSGRGNHDVLLDGPSFRVAQAQTQLHPVNQPVHSSTVGSFEPLGSVQNPGFPI